MIRYDLRCGNGHRFDAWFRNSDDFGTQAERGLLACPSCADTHIAKALMTPGVRTSRDRAEAPAAPNAPADGVGGRSSDDGGTNKPGPPAPSVPPPPMLHAALKQAAMRQMLMRMHEHVTRHARNVGSDFAKEARRLHEDEIADEGIYGQASREEVDDLLEDGIAVMPLPMPPESDA